MQNYSLGGLAELNRQKLQVKQPDQHDKGWHYSGVFAILKNISRNPIKRLKE